MSDENKVLFVKRFKSFLWRTGMLFAAVSVDFLLENLGLFDIPAEVTVVFGLVLGEVSKYLNTQKS